MVRRKYNEVHANDADCPALSFKARRDDAAYISPTGLSRHDCRLVEAIQVEADKGSSKLIAGKSGVHERGSFEAAAKMRAAILAERAKGTSAAKLAAKYGVSTAHIYMITR